MYMYVCIRLHVEGAGARAKVGLRSQDTCNIPGLLARYYGGNVYLSTPIHEIGRAHV